MTPKQIAFLARHIAGDRAVQTSESRNNLTITCADADIATILHNELAAIKLAVVPHRNQPNTIVVQLRPRQQIVIRKHVTSHYIGRFYGDRGER